MRPPASVLTAAVLTLAALPASASASASVLRVDRAVTRVCQEELLPARSAGAARASHLVRGNGFTTVRLAGRGDWDLAVFSASGRLLDAGATGSGTEQVVVAPADGTRIRIQVCRRSGRGRTVRLATSFFAMPAQTAVREPVQLVRVALLRSGDLARLEATGLDVTHNVGPSFADVVVYSAAERATLLSAGFAFTVREADMVGADRRHLDDTLAQARRAAAGMRALPSGRTAYRTYADYGTDLKALVDGGAGFVRRVEIGRSLEDRPIEGVEIADGVERSDDGRPTFLVLGVHHAREWPAGEMPMEFATDLVKSFKAGDARVKALLAAIRVVIVPIVNPDGFSVSRTAGPLPGADDESFATIAFALTDALAYKRKNCRATAAPAQASPCASRPAGQGVDPNRNYGAYWGGIGSSTDPTSQGFRGPSPYSEPESEAVHQISSKRNIVTLITHHTFTDGGTWLRQPGFCMVGAAGCSASEDVVPDEDGMRALGDAMGAASGWASELGWAIGEITGATEDWNYFAASAYGYTPEQRGVNFHPSFATAVIAEYDGSRPGAAGGVRESLLRAAEQSGDRRFHSVITGSAKPGATLRLKKSFDTATSIAGLVVKDTLDLTLTVPASGRYTWDVNPSTRPLSTSPEAYTMTCESGGTVADTKAVVVGRAASVTVDLCGGSTPAGAGPAAPGTATGPGGSSPTAGPGTRFSFGISRSKLTARIVNRLRRFNIGVRVTGGPLTKVSARLRRGKRVVARGTLEKVTTRAKVPLRRTAKLRRGFYVLELTATNAAGTRVKASKQLRVR